MSTYSFAKLGCGLISLTEAAACDTDKRSVRSRCSHLVGSDLQRANKTDDHERWLVRRTRIYDFISVSAGNLVQYVPCLREDEVRKMLQQSLPTRMHTEHDTYSSFTSRLCCTSATRMASCEQVFSKSQFCSMLYKKIHSYNATEKCEVVQQSVSDTKATWYNLGVIWNYFDIYYDLIHCKWE